MTSSITVPAIGPAAAMPQAQDSGGHRQRPTGAASGLRRRHALWLLALAGRPAWSQSDAPWAGRPPRKVSLFTFGLSEGGELLFIGTAHTNDPQDPQLLDIRERLKAFRPELVLVEGGAWPRAATPLDAVRRDGEMGFAANLARDLGIATGDADPPFGDEIAAVVRAHGPDRSKLFYALRMAPQFERAFGRDGMDAPMARWLRSAPMHGIEGTSLPVDDPAQLQAACVRWLPDLADWRDAAAPRWWREDGGAVTWLLDVQRTSSAVRDRHLTRRLASELRAGRRVLVVAGAAHLDAARAQLRGALRD